jgi:hypothetical protein
MAEGARGPGGAGLDFLGRRRVKAVKREQEIVFPSTQGRNQEKSEQLASFAQSPGNRMQKIEAEVMLTA